MEACMDLFLWLEMDMCINIFLLLDDPADLVRISSVSRSWRQHVIANGLCKQLCLRMFPQLCNVDRVTHISGKIKKPLEVGSSNPMEEEILEVDHRVYAFFVHACTSFVVGLCISEAILASSTDNFPQESIHNTLEPRDIIAERPSYWSSKGQSNPSVPETLTYKLVADLCVITEIIIQPFQAYFQPGLPIYSAESVRFRFGHYKSLVDTECSRDFAEDKFICTYISQEFPMAQENRKQKFKFPEPVLCVGGFLQIELLGRVQRQEMDSLFYICVSHVQVLGRSLKPAFDVEIIEPSGKFVLNYYSDVDHCRQPTLPEDGPAATVASMLMQRHVREDMDHILMLGGNIADYDQHEGDNDYADFYY